MKKYIFIIMLICMGCSKDNDYVCTDGDISSDAGCINNQWHDLEHLEPIPSDFILGWQDDDRNILSGGDNDTIEFSYSLSIPDHTGCNNTTMEWKEQKTYFCIDGKMMSYEEMIKPFLEGKKIE